MLTADGCRDRRARLWSALDQKPDWILLSEPRHLMYFANFYAPPFIFRTQNASALLILGIAGTRPGFGSTFINSVAQRLMRRKDPDEVALLRRVIAAMEAAFARAADAI